MKYKRQFNISNTCYGIQTIVFSIINKTCKKFTIPKNIGKEFIYQWENKVYDNEFRKESDRHRWSIKLNLKEWYKFH